jgi:hemoglobin
MTTETGREPAQNTSDYERVGGAPAIKAVVDRFYELVLGDEQLAGYFTDSDLPRLKRHQVLLVSQVMGGPAEYDGRDLQEAHAPLGITAEHFDLVVSYLVQALIEAGVPADIIGRVGQRLGESKTGIVAGAH